MFKDSYLYNIIDNLGIALNPKTKQEIIIKNVIKYNKISNNYEITDTYDTSYQDYGTIVADFLNTKFNDKTEFINFFNKYSLFHLENRKLLKLFNEGHCSKESYDLFVYKLFNKYKKTLIAFQKDISLILSFCITNPKKEITNLSPFQRLCILEYLPTSPSLLQANLINTIQLNTLSNIDNNNYLYKDLVNKLLNKEIIAYSNKVYIPFDIPSLLKFELTEIIKENIFLKTCNYCKKYFIAANNNISYCNNIAPGYTSKTCKQVGRNKIALEKKMQDDALALYTKIYNHKAYKASRYKDINTYILDYKHFQEIGRKKVRQYKDGILTKENFIEWINRNK